MATLVPVQQYTNGENLNQDVLNRPIDQLETNVENVNAHVEGLLNDSVIVTDKGWSSSKIYSELSGVQGFVGMVRMPDVIAPISGTTNVQQRATLAAGPYNHVYSGIDRTVRRFQLDLLNGDFSSPIYEFTGDVDSHSITYVLSTNTSYQWRCRDEADDGNNSAWTIPQGFTTSEQFVPMPELTASGGGALPTSMNENDNLVVVISNYDHTGVYTINVSGGTFTRTDAMITWTLPEVVSDTNHSISFYMTDTNGDSSPTATHTVNVLNVPIVGDDAIQITNYQPIQSSTCANYGFVHV